MKAITRSLPPHSGGSMLVAYTHLRSCLQLIRVVIKDCYGSLAAVVDLKSRYSAVWQIAELPRTCISGEFCSHNGQKRTRNWRQGRGRRTAPYFSFGLCSPYLKILPLAIATNTMSMDNMINAQLVKVGTDVTETGGSTGRTPPPVHSPYASTNP